MDFGQERVAVREYFRQSDFPNLILVNAVPSGLMAVEFSPGSTIRLAGLDAKLPKLTINVVDAFGNWIYNVRPTITLSLEGFEESLEEVQGQLTRKAANGKAIFENIQLRLRRPTGGLLKFTVEDVIENPEPGPQFRLEVTTQLISSKRPCGIHHFAHSCSHDIRSR